MYFSELLALSFDEIGDILKTIGRDTILQIFHLESNFIEHVYNCLLNSETEYILADIYHRLIKTQEIIYYDKLLHSDQIPTSAQ